MELRYKIFTKAETKKLIREFPVLKLYEGRKSIEKLLKKVRKIKQDLTEEMVCNIVEQDLMNYEEYIRKEEEAHMFYDRLFVGGLRGRGYNYRWLQYFLYRFALKLVMENNVHLSYTKNKEDETIA